MKKVRPALVLGALLLSTGCYRWVPAESGTVPVGTDVRATLTESGIQEATRLFGPDVEDVVGNLAYWNTDGVGLQREMRIQRDGFPSTTLLDTVRFQPQHLLNLEVKEFDGKNTVLLSLGIAGGAVLALLAGKSLGGGDDPEPPPPPIEEAILFRIPFSFGIR